MNELFHNSVPQPKTIRFLGLDLHCISYQDMF